MVARESAAALGRSRGQFLLAVVLPLTVTVMILTADVLEGPKTAFVGVLTAVPMVVAVFGSVLQVALVAAVNWISAFVYGLLAADGNVPAQTVRLVIIALMSLLALMIARIRVSRDAALQKAIESAVTNEKLARLSAIDDLTGLPNRRGGLAWVSEVANVGDARERTVAVVDIDRFKQVNDQHGHQAGDEFLAAVAGRLGNSVSSDDLVCRWGGDEFFLVLELPADQALPVLERMRATVIGAPVQTVAGPLPATISVGVAPWSAGEEIDQVVRRADAALYLAKRCGRNRIFRADDPAVIVALETSETAGASVHSVGPEQG